MIKGWRNDPKWVEHYQKRDDDRAMRRMDRVRSEIHAEQLRATVERLRKPPVMWATLG